MPGCICFVYLIICEHSLCGLIFRLHFVGWQYIWVGRVIKRARHMYVYRSRYTRTSYHDLEPWCQRLCASIYILISVLCVHKLWIWDAELKLCTTLSKAFEEWNIDLCIDFIGICTRRQDKIPLIDEIYRASYNIYLFRYNLVTHFMKYNN